MRSGALARSFDGTNDEMTMGSAVDDYGATGLTIAQHLRDDSSVAADKSNLFAKKEAGGVISYIINRQDQGGELRFQHSWSTSQFALWTGSTSIQGDGLLHSVCLTYDGSSSANDPAMTIDGSAETVGESTAPTGTIDADAAHTAYVGGDALGSHWMNGLVMCLCYANSIWDAAAINRHRWWGVAPGGPSTVEVWHPMWTDATANKGTAAADLTNNGSTMAAFPKVERMWGSMMGVGR